MTEQVPTCRKAPSFDAARAGTVRTGQAFYPSVLPLSFEIGGNPMRIHLRDRAPEALSTLAIIVFMGLFAAAVLYEGASFMAQSTTSSAPGLPHYLE
jgi:hypothetical protein